MSPTLVSAALRIARILVQPSGKAGAVAGAIGAALKLSPSQTSQVAGDVVLFASLFLLAVDDGTNTTGN